MRVQPPLQNPRKLLTLWHLHYSFGRNALVYGIVSHHMPADMNIFTRRQIMKFGAAGLALAASSRASTSAFPDQIPPVLLENARAALRVHRSRLIHTDRIGIVDFSRPSSAPRFFLLDMENGQASTHLVAHGRGSDPAHTGWVQSFSNVPGSHASSSGAYVTADVYQGAHGRSMRLEGLDTVNSNVEARAIVIHAAWYVTSEMARDTGMIGRSEGCFAVSDGSRDAVLAQLGAGRLIYAGKG
jgi:hypothetical protein